jgi:hypothetical protein
MRMFVALFSLRLIMSFAISSSHSDDPGPSKRASPLRAVASFARKGRCSLKSPGSYRLA